MEFEIKCDGVNFRFQEVNYGCSKQQEQAVFVNKAGWRADDRSVTAETIFEDVEERKPIWKYVHMHDFFYDTHTACITKTYGTVFTLLFKYLLSLTYMIQLTVTYT